MNLKVALLGLLLASVAALAVDSSAVAGSEKETAKKLANSPSVLLYSTSGKREPWCPQRAHFCIGAAESEPIRKIANPFLKPVSGNYAVNEKDGTCTSKNFAEGATGLVVYLRDFKRKKWVRACQPRPQDGAKSFVIALEPGKQHRQNLIVSSSYPVEFIGAPRPKKGERDLRPVIDCLDTIRDFNSMKSKGCNGVFKGTELTIDGFVISAGKKDSTGKWKLAGSGAYRCIIGGVKKLIVRNVDLDACPHGIQLSAISAEFSKTQPKDDWRFTDGEWHISDSRFTNCSPNGYGKHHCIYSGKAHGLIKIRRFYGTSCGGHVVKSNSRMLDMEDFHIEDLTEKCDVNSPIHNNAGRKVRLVNGKIVQNKQPKQTNVGIFTSGGRTKKGFRCTGNTNGYWYFKNITVVDKIDKPYSPEQSENFYRARHVNLCTKLPKATFEDGGGNSFHWLSSEPIDLIPVLEIKKRKGKKNKKKRG